MPENGVRGKGQIRALGTLSASLSVFRGWGGQIHRLDPRSLLESSKIGDTVFFCQRGGGCPDRIALYVRWQWFMCSGWRLERDGLLIELVAG